MNLTTANTDNDNSLMEQMEQGALNEANQSDRSGSQLVPN